MGVEMCKGKAKAARREPNGKYFGQNEPFFSLPFFAEIAGKDAYLVIFFRKYTNCIKICRRIEAAQSVISRPAIQIKILLRMVCQTAGKTNELCAQAAALAGGAQSYPIQIPLAVRLCPAVQP